jgi:hypothetical protein
MVLLDHRSESGVGADIVDENVDAPELFQGQVDTAPSLVFVHGVRGHADPLPVIWAAASSADSCLREVSTTFAAAAQALATASGGAGDDRTRVR